MISSCWLIKKSQTSNRLRKSNRVSPEESTNDDEVPNHREPRHDHEMTSIEEVCQREMAIKLTLKES